VWPFGDLRLTAARGTRRGSVPQPSARRLFQSHGGPSSRLAPVSPNEILEDELALNSRVDEQIADGSCYYSFFL
jgi:hypothetical protein